MGTKRFDCGNGSNTGDGVKREWGRLYETRKREISSGFFNESLLRVVSSTSTNCRECWHSLSLFARLFEWSVCIGSTLLVMLAVRVAATGCWRYEYLFHIWTGGKGRISVCTHKINPTLGSWQGGRRSCLDIWDVMASLLMWSYMWERDQISIDCNMK